MKYTRGYDDLASRLAAARAGEQISKVEFFTVLAYQAPSEKMLLLYDIVQVLKLDFQTAQAEFVEFEKNLELARAKKLYHPLQAEKSAVGLKNFGDGL